MSALNLPPPQRQQTAPPPPTASQATQQTQPTPSSTSVSAAASSSSSSRIPRYPNRGGFRPRTDADYGDGGAYPEIHIAQYPKGMGRTKSSQVVALTTDKESGAARFDAILQSTDAFVKSSHADLVPSQHLVAQSDLARPDSHALDAITAKTKLALDRKLASTAQSSAPLAAAHAAALTHGGESQFVQYTPASGDGTVGQTRVVKLVSQAVDPMEPPKFRHKKVSKGEAEAAVPVMHSPPRKVTAEDQEAWKVPPAISNWKNKGGFTIPLDKRLQADGRGLQEVAINDNFAKFAQSLYIAEQAAREEVQKRAAIQERIAMNEKEQHEEKLRSLAREARLKRVGGGGAVDVESRTNADVAHDDGNNDHHHHDSASASGSDDDNDGGGGAANHDDPEKAERDRIRAERRRERERQLRMEAMGNRRGKLTRDAERDVSERIALGMQVAAAGGAGGGEVQFDQRLFNQASSAQTNMGAEDEYNVYDGPMHKRGDLANHIYRPKEMKNVEDEAAEADAQYQSLVNNDKFGGARASKGFSGAERAAGDPKVARDGPVQFEKESEADPFGLDSFLRSAKEQTSAPTTERKRNHDGDHNHEHDRKRR